MGTPESKRNNIKKPVIVCWLITALFTLGGCSHKKAAEFRQYTADQFINAKRIGGGAISLDDRLILYFSNETGIINGYVTPASGGPAKHKIGIIGGSYGAYMALAALSFRPEAFTAGVDIFGVANWLRTLKNTPPWQTIVQPPREEQILAFRMPVRQTALVKAHAK